MYNNNIRLIRFLKIYSIYYHLLEVDTNQINHVYEQYLKAASSNVTDDIERDEMKSFIIYGRIN